MADLLIKAKKALASLWQGIREVTGDNAYDRYALREREKNPQCELLSREEFYRQRMEQKFNDKDNPSRCC